ncbi:PAS domain S-box protein, partial [Candidatus Cloacimonadota bacterium]
GKIKDLIENGTDLDFEAEALTAKGKVRWFKAHGRRIQKGGKCVKIYGTLQDITDQKKAQLNLKKSQLFNETLLNTSPDIIYIYDIIENENVYSNKGVNKILGYSIEEVQEMGDKLIPTLMHPDDFQIYLNETHPKYQSLKDEELLTREYRMKHKDGSWFWLQSRESIFVRNADGSPKQIFGMISDISESKKAETEIIEAKETAERYLDLAGSMILSLNPQAEITMINQKGLEILEYESREELIGKNWFDTCISPDINQEIKQVFAKIVSGEMEGVEHYDNEIVTKSGNLKTISWYNSLIKDETGNVKYLLSSGVDVTEINKVQLKIQESQTRYHNFISNSSEGIYRIEMKEPVSIELKKEELIKMINKNAYIAEVNIALADMYGLIPEDMAGKPAIQFAPNYGERAELIVRSKDHHVTNIETEDVDADSNPIYLSESYHGEIEAGKLIRIWGVQRDITEIKKAQIELKDSEDRYRVLSDNMNVGLVLHGPDTKILFSNPAASEILGWSQEQMEGKKAIDPAWKFFCENGSPMPLEEYPVNKVISTQKTLQNYIVGINIPDKEQLSWVSVNAIPVFNKEDVLSYVSITFENITKRKKNEEDIKRFSQIFEDSLNEIFLFDAETLKFIQVNNAAVQNLGYAIDELNEMTFLDIESEFNSDDFAELVKPLLEGKKDSIAFITVHNRKDGSLYDVEIHLQLLQFEHSKLFSAIVIDITERKLIEVELKDSEIRYRNLFDNSLEFLFTLDLKGNFTDVNHAAEVLTGHSKAELLKMSFKDYTPKKHHRKLIQAISNVYKTGKPCQNLPVEAIIKDKSKKYFETSFSLLKQGGEVIGFQGNSKDVTERKLYEEAIVKSERNLSRAQEVAHVGSWIWNTKTNELEMSDELYNILGLNKEDGILPIDVEGKMTHPDDRKKITETITESIETKKPYTLDYRIYRHDNGELRYLHVDTEFEEISEQEEIVIYGSVQDITERMQAEEELEKHREHLEELVRERTVELETKTKRLEDFNKLFVGREFRIKELRMKVKELEEKMGI